MFQLGDNIDKLRHEFQGNRFSASTAIKLGLEMLDALEELHRIGYIHRDVKESPRLNIVNVNVSAIKLCDLCG